MTKRIMVVDDDEELRRMTSEVLKSYGFEVVTAANGMDCLEKLSRFRVDLVLMDLFMPVMSGKETITAIRDNEKIRDTKIGIVTVLDMDDRTLNYFKKLGVIDVIMKPFEIGDLVYRIARMLKAK
ncbi:MAG: response regulator [Candidatus Altiarchaeota archaeon]